MVARDTEATQSVRNSGSRRVGGSRVVSLMVAVDNKGHAADSARRAKVRNLRVDITLGLLVGALLYVGWVQLDMGKRLGTLAANIDTLTQEVIKP